MKNKERREPQLRRDTLLSAAWGPGWDPRTEGGTSVETDDMGIKSGPELIGEGRGGEGRDAEGKHDISCQPEFVVTMPHQPHKQQGWGEYYHLLHSAS